MGGSGSGLARMRERGEGFKFSVQICWDQWGARSEVTANPMRKASRCACRRMGCGRPGLWSGPDRCPRCFVQLVRRMPNAPWWLLASRRLGGCGKSKKKESDLGFWWTPQSVTCPVAKPDPLKLHRSCIEPKHKIDFPSHRVPVGCCSFGDGHSPTAGGPPSTRSRRSLTRGTHRHAAGGFGIMMKLVDVALVEAGRPTLPPSEESEQRAPTDWVDGAAG